MRFSGMLLFFIFVMATNMSLAQTEIRYYNSPEREKVDLPFSQAVIVENMIYVSGNIGMDPVTGKLVPGGIQAEIRQTLENIKAILEANGTSMDKVVKVTVMLADMEEWPAMNEIYKTFFPGNKPARSAFGTSGLAFGARLEIECIAVLK